MRALASRSESGFTLIELVLVIVLIGIIAGVAVRAFSPMIQGYQDGARRAALVSQGDLALRRIARDLQRALPNSIRVTASGQGIEFVEVVDAARYRDDPPGSADQLLDFSATDTAFNLLGGFDSLSLPWSSSGQRLSVYHLGIPGADAYGGDTVMTASGNSFQVSADGNEQRITLNNPHSFAFRSPGQRIYLVEEPVTYLCDLSVGTLTRYRGYGWAVTQPSNPAVAPLDSAISAPLSELVSGCSISYQSGSSQRAGLVTLALTLSDPGGQRLRLLQQVHLEHVP